MAGIESIHANNAEDRRYKFYCCHSYWHRARLCKTSGYVNNWRSDFKFRVKRKNWFIVGAYSFHKNSKEDRRFKFQYCKVY
ncbi:Hemagglutinin/amebocyte aggregation factor [Exaiptasia diaphana]|nr:Hemagglutinin/amebocyte aggregation factor [Exaiptasia diaphana]